MLDLDSTDYRNKVSIDTFFVRGSKEFRLELKLDFDSSKRIVIPSKYVGVYGVESFQVYESYTMVRLYKGNVSFLDTAFYKKTYHDKIDSPLIKYGNLMFPNIYFFDKEVEINHSLSIPLTDVGIAVSSRLALD